PTSKQLVCLDRVSRRRRRPHEWTPLWWTGESRQRTSLEKTATPPGSTAMELSMQTGDFTTTLIIRIVFAAFMQLSSCHVIVADNGPTGTPAKIDKPFIVDFEFGRKATPFVDPDHPPVLELTGVSWNL